MASFRITCASRYGERGYLALWHWAKAEHAVTCSYAHLHRWVHAQLGASLKVARKIHGQKKTKNSLPSATQA